MADQFNIEFATHWDELVGWEKRSLEDTSFLLHLLKKFSCSSILDVAMGTGFHSIELIKNGYRVKSVDVSPAMIKVAEKNAAINGVRLDILCADWSEIDEKIIERFDCVICLGNSLACEMDGFKRQQAILNWSKILTDRGIIILDRRNYESLLNGSYNHNSKGQYFGDDVTITISKADETGTIFSYTFSDNSTYNLSMFPVSDNEIKELTYKCGLRPIEIYGDRKLSNIARDVAFYTYVLGRFGYEQF